MDEPSLDLSNTRSANWSGAVPVVLSLAPTSLSSPTVPPPLHRMVSRMTYLHVGLADEVRRLYKFAPATLAVGGYRRGGEASEVAASSHRRTESSESIQEGEKGTTSQSNHDGDASRSASLGDINYEVKYPVCWFEDESSGIALRWHLFVGVLYDLMKARRRKADATTIASPWRIRVHFTSYPTHQILSFADGDVLQTIERAFNNSLKQALFLQHGSSKVAMGLSKASHQKLWDAVVGTSYNLYEEVNGEELEAYSSDDGKDVSLSNVPVRVLVDGKPAIQRPCQAVASSADGDDVMAIRSKITLGDVLSEWVSHLFSRQHVSSGPYTVVADSDSTSWAVQGIEGVPFSAPIVDIWRSLYHPDHFLYVLVFTKMTS